MNKSLFIYGLLFSILGSFFSFLGIKAGLDTRSFMKTAIPGQGVVIDLTQRSSTKNGRTSYTYSPVVKFTTKQGKITTFASATSSNPPAYIKGQQVEILYNPQNPQSAIINTWLDIWGGSTLVIGLSSIFVLSGGWLMFTSFPTKSKS
jgi:hypothetical protein